MAHLVWTMSMSCNKWIKQPIAFLKSSSIYIPTRGLHGQSIHGHKQHGGVLNQ